ncbi:MAG: CoB--CoM heterodisulfide reductase iron-sulfur subunit A family protein [Dysgonamonadaceae bacterium]|jgi:heterodisulfide reductase subunit A|nr:CoB--CoM heterodisulfide reductase iron-sulfur subunit A family protein [Dysgonamonadaceae bacterium]MDD3355330.1 CoB--CoM heterodisulfide reductase iron-sulfur subunit A family protein [Dysgonamonadaceae bacterium]MDD3726730.1 CoB--CoM heterodisulfide reductase iron-sulfur subunit A family protein [Dysgonamonadaceae bacterium]MDD4245575.1 CoB--CoM heterodisulfide reductase iron-sulfur subunit A family protein [Dysgonamonadaceae bacterium]MDD4605274.1 CoB--CoM heterodisulfide reductase iron-
MKERIGVYICHCGGNISDYVDVEKVRQAVQDDEGVVLAKTTVFACSDSNQTDMVNDIKEHNLDGVIVSSCSPKLHLTTFRDVTERGELNKYTYVHANIREQVSWAHSDDKIGATEKAIHVVKAAIAKSRYAKPLYPNQFEAEKTIAVIGAGIAGLKAAISLSDKNSNVVLIEKENRVGGHTATWGSLFMTDERGSELIDRIYSDLSQRENVFILTGSEVISSKGSIGNFTLKIRKKPQIAGDPVETMEINVGSIVVATGFEHYSPEEGEFAFAQNEAVITLPNFKQLVDESSGKVLEYNGKKIKNIAYVYCVGSRQTEGENKYCSRYCCTSVIHTAIETKKKFKGIQNIHLNRGIRTYGKQELLYAESLQMGDLYLQFNDDTPPEIRNEGKKTVVTVKDILSAGRELEMEVDLVVLVTGMVPRKDQSIGKMLKLPKGRDKFYNEVHMKLRPVETVIDGITIAGTCQGPKNISESVNSALSAATKSFSYVSKGTLETEPIVAEVDHEVCSWCGKCAEACPFDAIEKQEVNGKEVAVINTSVCKGCGMCTPVCPVDAIDLIGYTSEEMKSMIEVLA